MTESQQQRGGGAGDGARADYSKGAAYVGQRYVPIEEASISVLDWGFTHSDVTYDVVHVWKGSFFRLDDHLKRFFRSCGKLRLTLPLEHDALRDVLMQCVRLSRLDDAYVEMVCTRGVPKPGDRDPRRCRNNFFAFAVPFIWIVPPEQQESGTHLVISSVPRIPPECVDPTAKNFHWGDFTRALFDAYDRGGDTTVLVDMQGCISEGPGFNVFCVEGDRVVSPGFSSGSTVLEGVTRGTVRELCDEMGLGFELARVKPDRLRAADEVFLSSTAGGIMPVAKVDGRDVGAGRPGPITRKLRDLYWRKHEEGWHSTPVIYD